MTDAILRLLFEALKGSIRLLHKPKKSSAFGLVRAVRSPNAAQNVQAAFRRVHAPRDTSAVRTGVY
jgi:hypothetical protein